MLLLAIAAAAVSDDDFIGCSGCFTVANECPALPENLRSCSDADVLHNGEHCRSSPADCPDLTKNLATHNCGDITIYTYYTDECPLRRRRRRRRRRIKRRFFV